MKLIVGLGNPGIEYENTRHNVGFMMIDRIALEYNLNINKSKMNGLFVDTIINGEKVILLKPQLYMNLSGQVVRQFVDYYKIDINDILIICDDLDLVVGKTRLRAKGSSGGHNGLKDIEKNLNTNKFKRLKIGISNNKNIDTKDYVLGKFSIEDSKLIKNAEDIVVNIFKDYLNVSFEALMSKYN